MVFLFMACLIFNFLGLSFIYLFIYYFLFCLLINTIANEPFSNLFTVSEGVTTLKVPNVIVSLKDLSSGMLN